jgi:hypothetical protein
MKANPLPGEQGAQTTADEAMSRFVIPDEPGRFISHGARATRGRSGRWSP